MICTTQNTAQYISFMIMLQYAIVAKWKSKKEHTSL